MKQGGVHMGQISVCERKLIAEIRELADETDEKVISQERMLPVISDYTLNAYSEPQRRELLKRWRGRPIDEILISM